VVFVEVSFMKQALLTGSDKSDRYNIGFFTSLLDIKSYIGDVK